MKNTYMLTVLILLSCIAGAFISRPVLAGEPVPSVTLTVPENSEHIEYLGLEGAPGDVFKLEEIKTDILLIELFSMYCPYCQAEAPLVNDFYEQASGLEEKGIRIRVIGLGASNTQFEVKYFADTYDIEFPLFPDEDLAMYNKFKGEGTPGFIGCLYVEGKAPVIVLKQSGGFNSAEEFLALLLQRAGFR